jgi:peptide/nickel transport system substrate-binding protein
MKRFFRSFFVCLLATLSFSPQTGCRRATIPPGMLVMAVEKAPKSLDPRIGNDSVAFRLQQMIFNTLLNKDERFEFTPELAAAPPEISPDAKIFTFRLKTGITFHDGRPLTSADVKYTFDTLREKTFNSPKKGDFAKVTSIETPDSQTVVFRCSEPNAPLLGSLVAVGVIPKDSGGTVEKSPIGTGPFRVVEYRENSDITLEANPAYFQGAPKVQKVRVRFILDNATRELEVRQGGVSLAVNADFAYATLQQMGKSPGLKLWQGKGTNIAFLGLNCEDPTLKDVRVRRAISFAIDREIIIRTVMRGMARPAAGPLPPEQWAYPPDLPPARFDPAEAKRLLDEAGFPDPDGDGPQMRSLKLELKTSSNQLSRQIAAVLQEQLRMVGIALALRSFEFQTFLQDTVSGNYQMYYLINVGANQSVDFLSYFYESTRVPTREKNFSEGANRSRYRNAEVDAWLAQAATTLDRAEQKRLYALVQKKIVEDAPQIFLWHPNNVAIASDQVESVGLEPSGGYYFLRDVTLKP